MQEQEQNNYLAACQKLGETPKTAPSDDASPREIYDYNAHVLAVCIAAENAIEQADGTFKEWKAAKDGSENTYEPWFIKSGSGWAYLGYDCWGTDTSVGPRLEYRTKAIMLSAVKKLNQEYNNYFNS